MFYLNIILVFIKALLSSVNACKIGWSQSKSAVQGGARKSMIRIHLNYCPYRFLKFIFVTPTKYIFVLYKLKLLKLPFCSDTYRVTCTCYENE